MNLDYQAYLNTALQHAVESTDDQKGELHLFIVQYHQAMLDALNAFVPCQQCSKLDLHRLPKDIDELQHTSFTSVPELMYAFKHHLSDLNRLCRVCRTAIQKQMLVRFYERREQ